MTCCGTGARSFRSWLGGILQAGYLTPFWLADFTTVSWHLQCGRLLPLDRTASMLPSRHERWRTALLIRTTRRKTSHSKRSPYGAEKRNPGCFRGGSRSALRCMQATGRDAAHTGRERPGESYQGTSGNPSSSHVLHRLLPNSPRTPVLGARWRSRWSAGTDATRTSGMVDRLPDRDGTTAWKADRDVGRISEEPAP